MIPPVTGAETKSVTTISGLPTNRACPKIYHTAEVISFTAAE